MPDVDLIKAMKSLPVRQRRVLILEAILGLSDAEIATEMGASEGTVRVWLFRGRVRMARALGESPDRGTGDR